MTTLNRGAGLPVCQLAVSKWCRISSAHRSNKKLLVTKGIAIRSKKLLVAPGIATRSKKLLVAKDIAIRSKKLLVAPGIATSNKKLLETKGITIRSKKLLVASHRKELLVASLLGARNYTSSSRHRY